MLTNFCLNLKMLPSVLIDISGHPGGSSGKEPTCQCRRLKRLGFNPWLGKNPWGRHGNSPQYSCLENPHGQRGLAGYSPWDFKELDTTERLNWTELKLYGNRKAKSFPGGSDGKQSACNTGDLGSIPGSGRSPGGGHDNPLQYSCLENPHGLRSLVGYSPWGCTESDMTEWLSTHNHKTKTYSQYMEEKDKGI